MLDYQKESELLKALAHPVRLRMAEGLMSNECHVDKMVRKLSLPQSTVSQHLAILRKNGIVRVRKEGVRTCYKIADPRVKELIVLLSK